MALKEVGKGAFETRSNDTEVRIERKRPGEQFVTCIIPVKAY